MPGPTRGIAVRRTLDTQQDKSNSVALTSLGLTIAGFGKVGQSVNIHFRCVFLLQSQGAGGFRFRFTGINSPMNAFRSYYDIDTGFVNMANLLSVVAPITIATGGSTPCQMQFEGTCNSTNAAIDLQWAQGAADPALSSVFVGSFIEVVAL